MTVIDLETPDQLEYQFFPVKKPCLGFKVKAPHDAHVALTTGPSEGNPIYEFFIGGWNNSKSALRKNKEQPDLATAETPNILTADSYKEFWINWDSNSLILGQADDPFTPLLIHEITEPFEITHFGVRTGWGATGSWVLDDEWEGYEFQFSETIYDYKDVPGSEGSWKWVKMSGTEVPSNAVEGGFDNEPIFIGRARHEGGVIPGKVLASHGVCYIPWGGKEHGVKEYQVLCDCQIEWVSASDGEIPPGALPVGISEDGETLYVGRVNHNDTVTVGKIHCSHRSCYIPYGGTEIGFPEYEVLVAK